MAGTKIDYAALFDLAPNAYMLLDRELRYVWANQAYLRVTGSRLEDLVGRSLFEAFPNDPDDPANEPARLLRESFARVLATGKPDLVALIPYRVQEQERYWSATHTPVLGERGEVTHILQHTVDVTELEKLRQMAGPALQAGAGVLDRARRVQELNRYLEVERAHLRNLFDQAPGFIAVLRGPEHVFDIANRAYMQLVGRRDLLGRPVAEALPEVVEQGFLALLDQVRASGRAYVGHAVAVQLRRDDALEEVVVDFLYQPFFDDDGKVAGIFVQGHDITAQKREEEQRSRALARAEAAEKQLRFLGESIPQQVWSARPDGTLDYVNGRVTEYFGVSSEQMVGEGWRAYVHEDDLPIAIEHWVRSLATGDPYEVHFRLRRHDGAYRWHLARALAQRDAQGNVLEWFGTNTDIHAEKTARDELAERSRFEQQLIGIVSHDLRNPLAAITMVAQMLLRSPDVNDRTLRGVARIESSADRMRRMIRDLLDFTQVRTGGGLHLDKKQMDLAAAARDVISDLRLVHEGRTIDLDGPPSIGGSWDPDRISQLMINLLTNALTYSPADSVIGVRVVDEGASAVFEVHNLGRPIPPELLPRIFEPMQRAGHAVDKSARSVGLGLYIVDSIVRAHGGTIGVTSTAEQGTTFTVTLPKG